MIWLVCVFVSDENQQSNTSWLWCGLHNGCVEEMEYTVVLQHAFLDQIPSLHEEEHVDATYRRKLHAHGCDRMCFQHICSAFAFCLDCVFNLGWEHCQFWDHISCSEGDYGRAVGSFHIVSVDASPCTQMALATTRGAGEGDAGIKVFCYHAHG